MNPPGGASRGLRRPRPRPPGALAPRRSAPSSPPPPGSPAVVVLLPLAARLPARPGPALPPRLPRQLRRPRPRHRRRRPAPAAPPARRPCSAPAASAPRHFAAGVAAVALLAAPLGAALSPSRRPVRQLPLAAWAAWLPLALPPLLVQTAAEEVAFRGYLMQGLAARFRQPLGLAAPPRARSSALLHWNPAEFGPDAWLVALSTTVDRPRPRRRHRPHRQPLRRHRPALRQQRRLAPRRGAARRRSPASASSRRVDPADPAAVRPLLLADLAVTLAAWAAWLAGRRRRLHSRGRGSI